MLILLTMLFINYVFGTLLIITITYFLVIEFWTISKYPPVRHVSCKYDNRENTRQIVLQFEQ